VAVLTTQVQVHVQSEHPYRHFTLSATVNLSSTACDQRSALRSPAWLSVLLTMCDGVSHIPSPTLLVTHEPPVPACD